MTSILTRVAASDPVITPLAPTRDMFDLPPAAAKSVEAGVPVPFTVDYETGQVYGVVAPTGRCLLDGSVECWTFPGPEMDDLSLSMQGTAELADGSKIKVGVIASDMPHVPIHMSGEQAVDMMSDVRQAFARVRYFHTPAGITAAGVMLPSVTFGEAVQVEAAAQSGDWRALWRTVADEGGRYRFTGSLTVNVPGLPLGETFVPGGVTASALPDGAMMVGWNPGITAADGKNHSKPVAEFLAESKKLTEQLAAQREQIRRKYESLLEQLSAVKVERGKQNRTEKRKQLRQQRSAELQSLREKAKGQRDALRSRHEQAMEALRKQQRSEREAFLDKVRSERRTLTDGGKGEQGQLMEGFKQRAKALQKRFADLREQISEEFKSRSENIADLEKDKRPDARRALAEARRSKLGELKERYEAERDTLAAQRADALEKFRVQKRKERNDLTDRQREERRRAKQGADSMPIEISSSFRAGQVVGLLDGSVARVASCGDFDGATVLVLDDGRVVDELDVDDAKVAASLYMFTSAPKLPHYSEVVYAGGRGLVCGFGRTPEGVELVLVRGVDDAGNIADYGDEVTLALADVRATGRVAEYVGHEDGGEVDGGEVELMGGDRLVDPEGPGVTPAQVASASCGCGGKTASVDVPAGNGMPDVEDPTGQIALDEIEALRQQLSALEAKVDVLVRAKQDADVAAVDAQVAALRSAIGMSPESLSAHA